MKKLVLLLVVLTAFVFNAQSQVTSDTSKNHCATKKCCMKDGKKCCFKFSSISLSGGENKYRTIKRDDFEFEKPSKDDNSGKMGSMMNFNSGDMTSRNQLTFEMGFNPYCKKLGDYNKKQELIIGLYYSSSDLANHHSEHFVSTPGDTIVVNSVKYQTDTVARLRRSYVEKANVLGAEVQYLFKTDPERKVSLFTGVGINAAYAVTTRIYESYVKDSAVLLSFYNASPNYDQFGSGNFLGNEEQKYHKPADPTFFASINMPFGVNFRLCKKKEILNQMNLFIKGNLGLQGEFVVHHGTHFNPYAG